MGITFFFDIGHFLIGGISPKNYAYLVIFAVFGGIIKYLWQAKTTLEYVKNLKVMVVLKTTDQGLSIPGIITLQ